MTKKQENNDKIKIKTYYLYIINLFTFKFQLIIK